MRNLENYGTESTGLAVVVRKTRECQLQQVLAEIREWFRSDRHLPGTPSPHFEKRPFKKRPLYTINVFFYFF